MSDESKPNLGRTLLLIGRIALAIIFLVAAYAKMKPQAGMPWSLGAINVSLSMFAMGVDSYQMLPTWAVGFVAQAIPIFELIVGLWVLSGIGLRFSALLTTLAVCLFITAMFSAYARGLTINCGCFGPGEQVGPLTVARDALLFLPLSLAVTIGAFVIHRRANRAAAGVPA
jgi:uncharacterized membrane protein YphA (DoxX/SURF4 family)